jgi:hypothetical protein
VKANIRYPDMTASEYKLSVDNFNEDISKDNRLSFIPRAVIRVGYIFAVLLSFYCVYRIWQWLTYMATGASVRVISACIVIMAGIAVADICCIYWLLDEVREVILHGFHIRHYEETYAISQYSEREDCSKQRYELLSYYEKCDMLRQFPIDDVQLSCNGDKCIVDIISGRQSISFELPYEDGNVDCTLIDFNRKVVIFPNATC